LTHGSHDLEKGVDFFNQNQMYYSHPNSNNYPNILFRTLNNLTTTFVGNFGNDLCSSSPYINETQKISLTLFLLVLLVPSV